jgi:DNA-binding LacI/PurR family transcriptional regulator
MDTLSKVTLLDVAREAGVSRATASNVFAHPDRVRPELRAKVEAAAAKLSYAGPDPKGRLLRAGKFHAVGVVSPGGFGVADALRNPSFQAFLVGVGEACDEAGANLVVVPDPRLNDGYRTALVDAFILGRVEHLEEIEPARQRRLPFVVVDFDPGATIGSVRVDARAVCRAAARHLLDLGHRRFGIVSFLRGRGPSLYHPPLPGRTPEIAGMQIDQEKLAGYDDALREAGLSIDAVPVVQANPWAEDAAPMLLDRATGITAVLSMAAMQGIAVIEEARRRGLSVPGDLSVVGFNDIPEARLCHPPLTTVDAMNRQKGHLAGRMVLGLAPLGSVVLAGTLVKRGSTGPAPQP